MKKLASLALMSLTFLCGSSVALSAPLKGVQAILLHRWGPTSVRNLSNTLRQYSKSEVEVSFAPNTSASAGDPYKNIRTIIKNLNGRKTLYVAVYLGFHSYSRSSGCGNRPDNSDLDLFLAFFNAYKDNPKVQVIVSPSLEDCGTVNDVQNSALAIARRVGVADIGKLILRRSPNGVNSESKPARCYDGSLYCYKAVEVEKHGAVENGSGATVYSNDGAFVWDNVSENREKWEKRGSFLNPDGTTSPQYSLTDFTSKTTGKRTNLWRPAYNMFRKCDNSYYSDKNSRDFKDCNNRAFGSVEMQVLKRFLDPTRAKALGGTINLSQGDSINSDNDEVTLMFQTDGNVVLYNNDTGQALWNTFTSGRTDATMFVMQSDGNLVLYAGAIPLWNAGVISSNAFLLLQDDHNLVIYSSGGVALWQTGTANQ